jgi:hypothetical protein
LCAPHLVALETQFRLRLLRAVNIRQRSIEPRHGRQLKEMWLVADMAIDAGDTSRLVRASLPEQPLALLVAGQACVVLLFDCIVGIFGETNRNGVFAASRFNVSFAGTMTGFAPQFFFLVFGARERLPHDCVLEVLTLVRMANDAGIAAHIVSAGLSTAGRAPHQQNEHENGSQTH